MGRFTRDLKFAYRITQCTRMLDTTLAVNELIADRSNYLKSYSIQFKIASKTVKYRVLTSYKGCDALILRQYDILCNHCVAFLFVLPYDFTTSWTSTCNSNRVYEFLAS